MLASVFAFGLAMAVSPQDSTTSGWTQLSNGRPQTYIRRVAAGSRTVEIWTESPYPPGAYNPAGYESSLKRVQFYCQSPREVRVIWTRMYRDARLAGPVVSQTGEQPRYALGGSMFSSGGMADAARWACS